MQTKQHKVFCVEKIYISIFAALCFNLFLDDLKILTISFFYDVYKYV